MTIERSHARSSSGFRRTGLRWAGALLLVAVGPGLAAAQQSPLAGENVYPPEPHSAGLEVTGYLGALTPLADLASAGDSLSLEFSTKLAFSLGLDFWFPSGLGIGVMGGYSRPDLTVQRVFPPEGGIGPTVSEELNLGGTDFWYGVGTLLYRPNLGGPAALVRPYFLAGGGVLHSGGGTGSRTTDGGVLISLSVDSSTKPVGVIGLGGHVLLGKSWFLRLEFRDYISSFDYADISSIDGSEISGSKMQNDLVSSIGFGFAL